MIPWACPKCGAEDGHGKGDLEKCVDLAARRGQSVTCMGFVCECEEDTEAYHGQVLSDPCRNAVCYHCGWGGTVPKKPKGILPWEKKALEAGWTPPSTWEKKL